MDEYAAFEDLPATPEAVSAEAQSRGRDNTGGASVVSLYSGDPYTPDTAFPGEGTEYLVGEGMRYAAARPGPYERQSGEPLYRPLHIYSRDPAVSRLEGAVATVNVPYEPLRPGPIGRLLEVEDVDEAGRRILPIDLDSSSLLLTSGREPSPSDPGSHQQMVYSVCSLVSAAFRAALGRHVPWGFTPRPSGHPFEGRLVIRPHALRNQANAFYDPERGELRFGYFRASADRVAGRNLPGGWVFACLSHDIVAHEVTHALLDGLRSRFAWPTGLDVLAFHEAFADLVALFQHFSYPQVVEGAIAKARGDLEKARALTELAVQFGQTVEMRDSTRNDDTRGLRSAIGKTSITYTPGGPEEPHDRGAILVAAVFDAYLTVFRRKIVEPVRLATNGSGILPEGELPVYLKQALAQEASKLAGQFLNICIRSIDYCPPVDIEFGEFLRAMVTADHDLVPSDPFGYREALVDSFRQRGIFPPHVASLSEDALLWRAPAIFLPSIQPLSFKELRFDGDPAVPAGQQELYRQACALGRALTQVPRLREECGLSSPRDPGSGLAGSVDLPFIESVRSARRVGPDGQIVFDLVAEVTQRRIVPANEATGGSIFPFYGGATLILGPRGDIRYVIRKRVEHAGREQQQRDFMSSSVGRRYWEEASEESSGISLLRPRPDTFQLLHREKM